MQGAIHEPPPGLGAHVIPGHVGVLDRVDVDRPAVGVLRPPRGAGHEPTVEARGVVGRHRARVAAAERRDRLYAAEREARVVEAAEIRVRQVLPEGDVPEEAHARVREPALQLAMRGQRKPMWEPTRRAAIPE